MNEFDVPLWVRWMGYAFAGVAFALTFRAIDALVDGAKALLRRRKAARLANELRASAAPARAEFDHVIQSVTVLFYEVSERPRAPLWGTVLVVAPQYVSVGDFETYLRSSVLPYFQQGTTVRNRVVRISGEAVA